VGGISLIEIIYTCLPGARGGPGGGRGVSTLWQSNAFPPHHHAISQVIHLYFITVGHLLAISVTVQPISSPGFESRFYSCSLLHTVAYHTQQLQLTSLL
jgi:hypothetical protein